jgi:peptide deformylase
MTPEIVTDKKVLKQISVEFAGQMDQNELIQQLKLATKTSWTKGCGLAAIQIGLPYRFAWYCLDGKEGILLNPVIVNKWGEEVLQEGCLSIPGQWVQVKRAYEIEYMTNGKKKRARGFLARLIQHEIDHMDGVLITDKKEAV